MASSFEAAAFSIVCASTQDARTAHALLRTKELPYQKPHAKGQTTMVLIVLVVIVFGGLVLFLFSLAGGLNRSEYMNIYTHNLLLSVMRTDTGQLNSDCKLVSDAIMSAFAPSGKTMCGASGLSYQVMAESRISEYLGKFDTLQRYRYLFLAKSGSSDWVPISSAGNPLEIRIVGNESDINLDTEKKEKLVANERIQKGSYVISVQLFLVKKPG